MAAVVKKVSSRGSIVKMAVDIKFKLNGRNARSSAAKTRVSDFDAFASQTFHSCLFHPTSFMLSLLCLIPPAILTP
jgi:hypothetical protein